MNFLIKTFIGVVAGLLLCIPFSANAAQWDNLTPEACVASANPPTYTEGIPAPCSQDLNGATRTTATFSGSLDTELPAPSALADSTANPTVPGVGTFNMCWNTATSLWDRCAGTLDPCATKAKLFIAISQTTGTQLFAGTASNRTYVCSVHVLSATAQNIVLVSGTGSVCASSPHAMIGGTTAATGWNFAANSGVVLGDGSATVAKSTTDADNICILMSSTGQLSGVLSYVVAAN